MRVDRFVEKRMEEEWEDGDAFEAGEEGSTDSDEAYNREQMEIALYSQIHFDPTDSVSDTPDVADSGIFDTLSEFSYDVVGDEEYSGLKPHAKTADVLLNRSIGEKYGNLTSYEENHDLSIYEKKNNGNCSAFKFLGVKDTAKKSRKKNDGLRKSVNHSVDSEDDVMSVDSQFSLSKENLKELLGSDYDSDDDGMIGVLDEKVRVDDNIQMNVAVSTKLDRFADVRPGNDFWG